MKAKMITGFYNWMTPCVCVMSQCIHLRCGRSAVAVWWGGAPGCTKDMVTPALLFGPRLKYARLHVGLRVIKLW